MPTPEARHRVVDSFTLQYYYKGFSVAYRPTPQGWKFWLWVLRRLARSCEECLVHVEQDRLGICHCRVSRAPSRRSGGCEGRPTNPA